MTFLKKLGQIALQVGQVALGLSPVTKWAGPGDAAIIDRIVGTIDEIGAIIMQVEAIGAALQLTGPDKLKAAAPLVAQVIVRSSLVAGKKIADPNLFHAGVEKVA